MSTARPQVLFAFGQQVRDSFLDPAALARLERFADWHWLLCEGGGRTYFRAHDDPATIALVREQIGAYDALVVCHGAPFIDAAILEAAPKLQFIGELEGDRFAGRIDLEAAWARGIRTVDVTNASSLPARRRVTVPCWRKCRGD